MALSNGSPGLAHHERPEYADKIMILEQDTQQMRLGLQALLTGAGLTLALALTAILLALLNPVLLLLPALAVPPLMAGRWGEKLLERAREATATQTRMAMSPVPALLGRRPGQGTARLRPPAGGAAPAQRAVGGGDLALVAGARGVRSGAGGRPARVRRRLHRRGTGGGAWRGGGAAHSRRRGIGDHGGRLGQPAGGGDGGGGAGPPADERDLPPDGRGKGPGERTGHRGAGMVRRRPGCAAAST